jgi:peptidoglycan/LPS O-acetylase OafA/YrhL
MGDTASQAAPIGAARSVPADLVARPEPIARQRLDHVDGLRAVAALWIVLGHSIESSVPRAWLNQNIAGAIVGTLYYGQVAVMVFLVLSGFCLYYPCVRRNRDGPVLGVTYEQYLYRRARRIMPPYLVAGALCLALTSVPGIQIGRWSQSTPVDRWVVLTHLTMLHNLIPSHASKIDYPMWSLGLEWQLYLLFPALVWAFRRFGGAATLVACMALMILSRLGAHVLPSEIGNALRRGPLGFIGIFCAGMLAAQVTLRGHAVRRYVWPITLALGLVIVRLSNFAGLVHDVGAITAAFSALMLGIDEQSFVSRVLRAPWLVALGRFSYSLYLMHAPCLHLVWLGLRTLRLSPEATFVLLVLLGGPISIAVSYGFHRAFELPFMNHSPRPTKMKPECAV